MSYALIVDGAVAAYPYSFRQLRKDNPQVSYPKEPGDLRLADFGVVRVADAPRPASDLTKNIVEGTPALVDGVWTRTWNVVDASAEEIAARQAAATEAAEREEVKLAAAVEAFINASPDQVTNYVESTANNLAGARTVLNRLALMLHAIARREFRDE